jgi:hypothetical protein
MEVNDPVSLRTEACTDPEGSLAQAHDDGRPVQAAQLRGGGKQMTKPLQVTVQPTTFQVRPDGTPVLVRVQIQNTGANVDQFQIEVNDLDAEWYTVPAGALPLFPQERGALDLQIHPPKGTTRAGSFPFSITVTSRADPSVTMQVPLTFTVPKVAALDVDMSPRKVIGRVGHYRLLVRNLGNADASLEFDATDPEEECEYRFRPEDLEIEPGERATIQLRVKAGRSNLVGQRKQYDFQIKVKFGPDQPKLVQGQLVHTPRFSTRRPLVRLVTLVLLVSVLGVGYLSVGSIGVLRSRVRPWQDAVQKLLCTRMNVLCSTPTGVLRPGTKGVHATPTAVPTATTTGALLVHTPHALLPGARVSRNSRVTLVAAAEDPRRSALEGAVDRSRRVASIAVFAHGAGMHTVIGSSGVPAGLYSRSIHA